MSIRTNFPVWFSLMCWDSSFRISTWHGWCPIHLAPSLGRILSMVSRKIDSDILWAHGGSVCVCVWICHYICFWTAFHFHWLHLAFTWFILPLLSMLYEHSSDAFQIMPYIEWTQQTWILWNHVYQTLAMCCMSIFESAVPQTTSWNLVYKSLLTSNSKFMEFIPLYLSIHHF